MKHKLTTELLLVLCVPIASATRWYENGVRGSKSNKCKSPTTACKTIGHAISLAVSGDSIIVAHAIYAENLTIGKNMTILGSGAASTIIDGGGTATLVTISNGTHGTLSKRTIRNGKASTVVGIDFTMRAIAGGGISNSCTLTLTNI